MANAKRKIEDGDHTDPVGELKRPKETIRFVLLVCTACKSDWDEEPVDFYPNGEEVIVHHIFMNERTAETKVDNYHNLLRCKSKFTEGCCSDRKTCIAEIGEEVGLYIKIYKIETVEDIDLDKPFYFHGTYEYEHDPFVGGGCYGLITSILDNNPDKGTGKEEKFLIESAPFDPALFNKTQQ